MSKLSYEALAALPTRARGEILMRLPVGAQGMTEGEMLRALRDRQAEFEQAVREAERRLPAIRQAIAYLEDEA